MALTDKLTAIADAIRTKTGKTDGLTLEQMPAEITGISGGAGVEECAVTFTCPNNFTLSGGICYTKIGSDGEITSVCNPVTMIDSSISGGTFYCVKGSTFIAHKGSMPAVAYTATTTGAVTKLMTDSATDHTIMVFRVDGDCSIVLT